SGLVTFIGAIDAASSNVQSLFVRTKGGAIFTGNVGGDSSLNTITLTTTGQSTVGGSARFEGEVSAETAFVDLRTSAASLEIDGGLFTANATLPGGNSTVTMLQGGFVTNGLAFTNTGTTTLGGTFTTSAGPVSFAGPVVLASDVT